MRIILANDRKELRSALRVSLEAEDGLEIVGETQGLKSLVLEAAKCKPDLILLDWETGAYEISEIIPVLKKMCPGVRLLAMSSRPEACKQAMASGADAFVSKGEHPEKLLEIIRMLNE